MTVASSIEHQITRELLQRRSQSATQPIAVQPDAVKSSLVKADTNPWIDRLIAILAVTAGLVIMGSYVEELLWAMVAATTLITLR